MWNLIETLFLVSCVVGCGVAPPAESTVGQIVSKPSPNNSPVVSPTVVPLAANSPAPGPSIVPLSTESVTYYSLSKTVAPQSGWPTKTYTATGSCVVYAAKTYCWDDGMKVLTWTSAGFTYGPFYYTYWSLGLGSNNLLTICGGSSGASGGCASDLMTSPTLIAGQISSNINHTQINTILTTGSSTQVDCTKTDGVVDCGTFQIDTNQ